MIESTSRCALARYAVNALALALVALFAGCAAPLNRAPVEDRGSRPVAPAGQPPAVAAEAAKPAAPADSAGRPGFYTVKAGDTLIRIGLDNGQNWRDIARWNNIENANLLEVGQVLRVVAPGTDPSLTATRPVAAARVEARPLDTPTAPATAVAPTVPAGSTALSATAAVTAAGASAPAAASLAPRDDEVAWAWPAAASLASPFDEARSKGLTFAGKVGDPVFAAGDGRVIYVGSGVRGYGNLVIVKHNNTYLTAYAHNQVLLVKEDQVVRRGQKIAEMGSSDADRVQLHFEIRRLGKPVDPSRLLPPR